MACPRSTTLPLAASLCVYLDGPSIGPPRDRGHCGKLMYSEVHVLHGLPCAPAFPLGDNVETTCVETSRLFRLLGHPLRI